MCASLGAIQQSIYTFESLRREIDQRFQAHLKLAGADDAMPILPPPAPDQQGGLFVLDGPTALYAFEDPGPGAHAPNADVLEACCAPAASTRF